jgi:hypothetical protein
MYVYIAGMRYNDVNLLYTNILLIMDSILYVQVLYIIYISVLLSATPNKSNEIINQLYWCVAYLPSEASTIEH